MRYIILILLVVSTSVFSEDSLDSLIIQLDNENFEIREEASIKLSLYSKEYAEVFIKLSQKEENPEIRERLFRAGKDVFYNKLVKEYREYTNKLGRLDIGALDFSADERYYMLVSNSRYENLKSGDIILEIVNRVTNDTVFDFYNGTPTLYDFALFGNHTPGDEFKIVILRPNEKCADIYDAMAFVDKNVEAERIDIVVKAINIELPDEEELKKISDGLFTKWIRGILNGT